MIKKLRWRFVAVFMTSMTLLVLIVLGTVFVTVASTEISQTKDLLEKITKSERVDQGYNFRDDQNFEDKRPDDPLKRIEKDAFLVKFTSNSIYPYSYEYQSGSDFDSTELFNIAFNINSGVKDGTIDNEGIVEFSGSEYRYLLTNNCLALVSRGFEQETIKSIFLTLLFSGAIALAVLFLISLFLAWFTSRPVANAWQKQKEFVADASHELKTPLTVIDANIDVVLSNENQSVEEQRKWLLNIKEETKSMSLLVNDLLTIAKSDAKREKFEQKLFDISDVVENISLAFESVAFEKGKNFNSKIEPDLSYNGDEDSIKQLVKILLDNAIKYSGENGNVFLELKEKDKKIMLIVSNDGELIPKSERNKVFERFYRVEKSRARVKGGTGLGLSIAKTIVERHNGNIYVDIIDKKYNSFVVTL